MLLLIFGNKFILAHAILCYEKNVKRNTLDESSFLLNLTVLSENAIAIKPEVEMREVNKNSGVLVLVP